MAAAPSRWYCCNVGSRAKTVMIFPVFYPVKVKSVAKKIMTDPQTKVIPAIVEHVEHVGKVGLSTYRWPLLRVSTVENSEHDEQNHFCELRERGQRVVHKVGDDGLNGR